MKKLTKPALWVLAISLAALFSCNDPSAIGSDLLSGEDLDTDFTDTLTLRARTVTSDSIRVWDSSASGVDFQNFAFGDFQDPIFGRSVSSIYAQMLPSNNKPDFGGSTTASLDSVVIMLAYNPALCYGKLDEPFTMELYEMDQSLDNDEVYYNTDSFAVKAVPFATAIFVPNIEDSLTIFSARADTVYEQILPAHLRITLAGDDPFALSLFNADTSVLNNDSVFLESFRGFWLKPASTNAGMLSFAMRPSSFVFR